ncbi:MAG: efflux RND transporter periplasmic adaptor subunit [Desulfobacterales bacterium]|nr:efflux RND transporter periplasmic adaptor subunit [Desulfobacterales bacterium]
MENHSASFLSRFLRIIRVPLVLGAALILAFILLKAGPKPQRKPPETKAPGVRAQAVYPEDRTMTVEAFGTLSPRKKVRVIAEVPGRILWINPGFKAGGALAEGSALVRMDDRTHALDHRSARVRVRQARIDIRNLEQETRNLDGDIALSQSALALARRELDRIQALNKRDFASVNSLDRAEQQHLSAQVQLQSLENRKRLLPTLMDQKRAALSMAEISADMAALNLSKTEIKTPFKAWVLEKNVEVGEFVNPGQGLGSLYLADALDLEVAIPLEQLQWLGRGLTAPDGNPDARARLKAWVWPGVGEGRFSPDRAHAARVARLGAAVDETTRTLPMTLELVPAAGDTDFILKPGTFVNCRIQGLRTESVYVLPRHWVHVGQRLYLYEDGKLRIQKVSVLRTQGEVALVHQGVNPGDQVITSPLPGAVDGMALVLLPSKPESGGE